MPKMKGPTKERFHLVLGRESIEHIATIRGAIEAESDTEAIRRSVGICHSLLSLKYPTVQSLFEQELSRPVPPDGDDPHRVHMLAPPSLRARLEDIRCAFNELSEKASISRVLRIVAGFIQPNRPFGTRIDVAVAPGKILSFF